ncbi:GGDEF domain-containing protein [Lysobacter sp. TY2-98]|uniref:GGDEF domain-containing protein n=1 Tax=Lysobacter sp. TY2-98 TaxID=2290922 RepID=UPI000E1FD3FB|nr:GGDEF domain-containing protein [Lysobacter sp. TY2-98]AXK71602.1 GGDEF domain-containing protein [Lysobacter sp. TY2-98]
MTRILLALALVLAATAARAETVDAILDDVRLHGFVRPQNVLQRLYAADDRPGEDAPATTRATYLIAIEGFERQRDAFDRADPVLARLERMVVAEHCQPCDLAVRLSRAQRATGVGHTAEAQAIVARAEALSLIAGDQLRFEFLLTRARVNDLRTEMASGIADAVQARALAARHGWTADEVRAMSPMVGMNADLGDFARAEALGNEAYRLAERIGFAYLLPTIRAQQAYIYSMRGDGELQRQALLDVLRLAGDDASLRKLVAITLGNLSDYYLQTNELQKALDVADRARALSASQHDDNGVAVAGANRGIALVRLGRYDEGIADLLAAKTLAERIGARTYLLAILDELVKAYEKAGRLREAVATMHAELELNQEMVKQERDKAVLELQEKYASERRGREIERLSIANRAQAAEMEAHRWQQRLWTTVAVLSLLALVALVRYGSRERRANRKLSGDIAVLSEQTMVDPLTGVANRRWCEAEMQRRVGSTVGLMLLDVDFFKRVNDTWGHAAGDRVLVEIGRRLRALVRQNDAVVRWGGEEFALLLPDAAGERLPQLAERVMQHIAGEPIDIGGQAIVVSVSIGAVMSPLREGVDWQHAMHVADLALYMSKGGGRNCATCVVDVVPTADVAAIANDLAAASARGDVTLQMVEGPSPARRPAARVV